MGEPWAGLPPAFSAIPTLHDCETAENVTENVRSALSRGLPELRSCSPRPGVFSVVGGGPSLARTYHLLEGRIAAGNGAHNYLIERGVIPYWAAVMDPTDLMVDLIDPHPEVMYFFASCVHPRLFDKFKNHPHVVLWHTSCLAGDELERMLVERGGDWTITGGGSTIGLRLINLGYALGFRDFHLHGMDSSVLPTGSHAYPDSDGYLGAELIRGYLTCPVYASQVREFYRMLEKLKTLDPTTFKVFGEGLFQYCWREHQRTIQ